MSTGRVITPLAPVNSRMPNSLSVNRSTRLPPAISAGHASGMTIERSTRSGDAPRLAATSSWARGSTAKDASSGRTTNGVKNVISAAITPAGVYRKFSAGDVAPVRLAMAAFTAPALPYRNVNANVMRNDGSASTVSISRPTTREPGNGTKASTIARNMPSTRQPTVDVTAIATVRHNASRNICDARTSDQVDQPRWVSPTFVDSRQTRNSG